MARNIKIVKGRFFKENITEEGNIPVCTSANKYQ